MRKTIVKLTSRARIALFVGAIAVAGVTTAFSKLGDGKDAAKATPVRLVVDDSSPNREGKFTTSFAPVVKRVAPSVVKIFVSGKAKTAELPEGMEQFRRFFGNQFDGQQRRGQAAPRQHGLGSGVIVTKEGYILTNNHVVDEADEVKVSLNDGRDFKAKVVGKDPKSDIAVLKIDATDLPFLALANSDKIEIGDVALAVGNPFGIGQTVTMGIISATGRGNMGIDYEDFIQTDASINPGNSGGALVDGDGRLIGINTAILSRSGGNQGIGFAVPVNIARNVMEGLIKEGRVVRGYIGVGIQDLNPALAEQFNVKETSGALVSEVKASAPADKAGLKSGDVIVEWNGKAIHDSRQLKLQVSQTRPGEKATVKVLREGSNKTFTVTPRELPGTEVAMNSRSSADADTESLQGVSVGDIDVTAKSQLRLPDNLKGALVTSVDENSAAFEAGLREGDVIQEINRKPVKNAEEAIAVSEKLKAGTTLLRVWSNGASHFVAVKEGKDKLG
ncbi:MAG: DegQ family serine endoprotease [Verrucomicrobiota bacterium]